MDPQPLELQPDAPTPENARRFNRGEILRIVLIGLFIVGVLVLMRVTPMGRLMSFKHLRENIHLIRDWLKPWGAWAWVVFMVLGTVILSFGFPRVMLSAIAGIMFGVVIGTILAELVTTISAIPPFYYTMFLGREMVERRLGGRLQRFNALLEHHGFKVLLIIRLCPVGNAFVTNCLAGLSAIPFRAYLLSSALGFLPMTVIYAWLGESLLDNSASQTLCSLGSLVACTLLFGLYFRRSSLARDVMAIMREGK